MARGLLSRFVLATTLLAGTAGAQEQSASNMQETTEKRLETTQVRLRKVVIKVLEAQEGWQRIESENFIVHHQDSEAAKEVADICEETFQDVREQWGITEDVKKWRQKCYAFLYPTKDSFHALTGQPRVVNGFADAPYVNGDVPWRRIMFPYNKNIRNLVRHEATHGIIAKALGNFPVPRWGHEAIATHSESDYKEKYIDPLPALASQHGPRHSVRAIMDMQTFPNQSHNKLLLAYSQSVALMDSIVRYKGRKAAFELLRVGARKGNDAAVQEILGFTNLEDLEEKLNPFQDIRVAGVSR